MLVHYIGINIYDILYIVIYIRKGKKKEKRKKENVFCFILFLEGVCERRESSKFADDQAPRTTRATRPGRCVCLACARVVHARWLRV